MVTRWILHLDMDAFFAAVEQLDDPSLRGKPLLIGHDGPRGVVATASYEARPYGCHSAQPMAVARRLCPDAIILPVRMRRYSEASRQMFAILDQYSPVVEPLSIDEAFLDLAGTEPLIGPPPRLAERLKQQIREQLGLTASIGLAPNKFLAKLASDMNKPDGLTIIPPQQVQAVLDPMPVTRLWGIGRATAARLESRAIRTIAQLRRLPRQWFDDFFGSDGQRYHQLCRGIDSRPVVSDGQARSISHEQTFATDVTDPAEIRSVLLDQVEHVAQRLRRQGLTARGVALKIRFGDFQTISRSHTLACATDATHELWQAAQKLFDNWPFQPVRLIGFAAERLNRTPPQPTLFPDAQHLRRRGLDTITDQINQKFGPRTIHRGRPA
jgi:DNA polymerase IV